jgi:hypothetical protein
MFYSKTPRHKATNFYVVGHSTKCSCIGPGLEIALGKKIMELAPFTTREKSHE